MPYPARDPVARFWNFVRLTPHPGCWPWQGHRLHYGHGQFWDGKQRVMAHRFAYELLVGPIPDGMFVCHHCDNPPCVNPKHLFLGTQLDNMRDKVAKGRHHAPGPTNPAKGGDNGRAVLTQQDVDRLRSLEGTTSISALSREFGIGRTQVGRILRRESWP